VKKEATDTICGFPLDLGHAATARYAPWCSRVRIKQEASLKRNVASYQIERNHSKHATLETKLSVTLLSFLLAFLKQDITWSQVAHSGPREFVYLEWLFMLVLPVALHSEPCSRHAAISLTVRTSISVTPAKAMPPSLVSRIVIGAFPGRLPGAIGPLPDGWMPETRSSRSLTSSLWI
jgi:hypothetical protein